MQPTSSGSSTPSQAVTHGFPDPSLTLVEFSDEGLGVLLAMKTDRDVANRRIVLSKVAYVRLEPRDFGFAAYPEVWIQQNPDGVFFAIEPKSGKNFRFPSRRRYEIGFLGKEIFECAIQCLKERKIEALYELIGVTFGSRPEFSIESGCLLAPEDYAAEMQDVGGDVWIDYPATGNGKNAAPPNV